MLVFRKAKDGAWAVYGPLSELRQGPVTVNKADGTQQVVHVVHVSLPFDVQGVMHAFGFLRAPEAQVPKCPDCGRKMRPSQYNSGFYCPDQVCRDAARKKRVGRPVCAACGKPGTLVTDMEDGLPKHWKCCDLPPLGEECF